MGYLIGVVMLLWIMSKATKKKDTVRLYIDKPMYVTCDELDELICKMDELEEMVKEMNKKTILSNMPSTTQGVWVENEDL